MKINVFFLAYLHGGSCRDVLGIFHLTLCGSFWSLSRILSYFILYCIVPSYIMVHLMKIGIHFHEIILLLPDSNMWPMNHKSWVFLLHQLWNVNYYVKSSSNNLINENINTAVSVVIKTKREWTICEVWFLWKQQLLCFHYWDCLKNFRGNYMRKYGIHNINLLLWP